MWHFLLVWWQNKLILTRSADKKLAFFFIKLFKIKLNCTSLSNLLYSAIFTRWLLSQLIHRTNICSISIRFQISFKKQKQISKTDQSRCTLVFLSFLFAFCIALGVPAINLKPCPSCTWWQEKQSNTLHSDTCRQPSSNSSVLKVEETALGNVLLALL